MFFSPLHLTLQICGFLRLENALKTFFGEPSLSRTVIKCESTLHENGKPHLIRRALHQNPTSPNLYLKLLLHDALFRQLVASASIADLLIGTFRSVVTVAAARILS